MQDYNDANMDDSSLSAASSTMDTNTQLCTLPDLIPNIVILEGEPESGTVPVIKASSSLNNLPSAEPDTTVYTASSSAIEQALSSLSADMSFETKKIKPCLQKLPFELFELVLRELDEDHRRQLVRPDHSYFEWNGRMPALIVALRGNPRPYDHVLQWFEKANTPFRVDSSHFSELHGISDAEVLRIREVRLNMSVNNLGGMRNNNRSMTVAEFRMAGITEFARHFRRSRNLRQIEVVIGGGSYPFCSHLLQRLHFITNWPLWLQGCHQLSKVELTLGEYLLWRLDGYEPTARILPGVIKGVSGKLGINGETMYAYGDWGEHARSITSWEAEVRKPMDWSLITWKVYDLDNRKYGGYVPWNFFDDEHEGSLKFPGGIFVIKNFCSLPKLDYFEW